MGLILVFEKVVLQVDGSHFELHLLFCHEILVTFGDNLLVEVEDPVLVEFVIFFGMGWLLLETVDVIVEEKVYFPKD